MAAMLLPLGIFLAALFLAVLVLAAFMKARLLATLGWVGQLVHASPEGFPQLDQAALARYSRELANAGFVPLAEATSLAPPGQRPPFFTRVFTHPDYCCLAQIVQAFTPAGARPMRCVIVSYLGEDWSLTTTDRAGDPAARLFYHPRRLAMLRAGATVDTLVADHLARRNDVAAAIGARPVSELTWEEACRRYAATSRDTAQALERKNLVVLLIQRLWLARRPLPPNYEWLGDYRALASRTAAA